jgi:hypothetical protein
LTENKQTYHGFRLVVAAFGILCGLTGIIAGIFEVLQGNVATTGFEVSYIGPSYSMADDFTYFAITIVPNYLVTGILAIIVSSLVLVWSVLFVHRRYGTTILLVLSITQMLVGGGWVIDLALIMCILSTRIDRPLDWWRSHLPESVCKTLAKTFSLSVLMYSVIASGMLILSIIGVNDLVMLGNMTTLATLMFIPILLMIFGGLAQQIQKIPQAHHGP